MIGEQGRGAGCRGGADPPREVISQIHALCDRSLFLHAHAAAAPFGAIEGWTTTAGRLVAARLAAHLGAPKLSRRLGLRAYRHDRRAPEAILARADATYELRGPIAAWNLLRDLRLPDDTEPEIRSRLTRVRARAASALRDFETAARLLDQAERESPRDPWSLTERAAVLEREDRYEEALEAAREGLAMEPRSRGALLVSAQLLAILGRAGEAIDLLAEAEPALESAAIALMLSTLLGEEKRYEEERRALDRAASLSLLIEPDGAAMIACRRSDCAYHLGDVEGAIREARRSGSPFFERIASHLEARREGRRVLLDVPFVRQHHLTCVPATLAALCRFWGREAAHLEIVEAICYDGTPAHSERRWAEDHGWEARELTITWESAKALIDRGVPFSLTTAEPGSAHMQAVIGYDERRGSLYVRDPFAPVVVEAVAELFLERYRSIGPRGLAIVPREDSRRLEGIELPDAELYDALHRVEIALEAHDRAAAVAAQGELEARAPDHLLTLRGRRALGAYDSDTAAVQASVEALLARFPEDGNAELTALACMRETASREARIARVEARLAKGPTHPVFLERLGSELSEDPREKARTARVFRMITRALPERAEPLVQLGTALWRAQRFDEALEHQRFAACVEPTNEAGARHFFVSARMRDRTDEALALLAQRDERLGGRSSRPSLTRFDALEALDRADEAFAVLDRALARRPDDGDLMLAAALAHGRHGRAAEAHALLDEAEGRAHRGAWLRTAASIADALETPEAALPFWLEVVELEPFAEDANRAAAGLLAVTAGPDAAKAHLDAACARFPENRALLRLRAAALAERGLGEERAAIEAFLAIEPASAWARQALAVALARQKKPKKARKAIEAAAEIDPGSAAQALAEGRVALLGERIAEARASLREAIRRDPDGEEAIAALTGITRLSRADRIADLAFIEAEAIARSAGPGVVAWYDAARRILAPEDVLAALDRLRDRCADLEAAWSLSANQLAELHRKDEALAIAEEAARRFPLAPRAWCALSDVRRLRGDREGEAAALERALAFPPSFTEATHRLADAHLAAGAPDRARALLERAIARAPLDASLVRRLSDVLWQMDEHEEAVERDERALRLDPANEKSWKVLATRAKELGQPDRAIELARDHARARPWDAAVRICLARLEHAAGDAAAALAIAGEAAAAAPLLADAHDLRAGILAGLGRREEALAACAPEAFGERIPIELRGRAAQLTAMFGDVPAAIERMRALLDEEPAYVWGWSQLAGFYEAAEQPEEQLEASRRLAELLPRLAGAHAAVGDACARLRDVEGARAAYGRALDLSPEDAPAALALIDLEIAGKEPDRARRALDAFAPHAGPGTLPQREIALALLEDDTPRAEAILAAACVDPSPPDGTLVDAVNALIARDVAAGRRVLEAALDDPAARDEVGDLWVKVVALSGSVPRAARLRDLYVRRGELGARAAREALGVLGRKGDFWGALWVMARLFRGREADVETWAHAGHALLRASFPTFAAAWLSTYRRREGVRPWMLVAHSFALRRRLLDRRAREADRFALAREEDGDAAVQRVWLAHEEALEGATGAARALVDGLAPEHFELPARQILHFVRAMLLVQGAPDRARALAAAKEELALAYPDGPPTVGLGPVDAAYARARRRIALDARTAGAIAWAFRAWLVIAAVLLLLLAISGGPSSWMSAPMAWGLAIYAALRVARWGIGRI